VSKVRAWALLVPQETQENQTLIDDFFNPVAEPSHPTNMRKIQASVALLFTSVGACSPGSGNSIARTDQPLELHVECAADSGMGADQWVCPADVQVDCSAQDVPALQVLSPDDVPCNADVLKVTHNPLTPGKHDVQVRNTQGGLLCTSRIEVVRTSPIELVQKSVKLWPPNHKLHDIRVEDCVEVVGACPGEKLNARFTWASSDEPVNAKGDGNHEPDILVSNNCQQISVRSERQGPSDGRVYTLGVQLIEASGVAHETTCTVSVDHDQRGRDATASADAYRLDFDGTSSDLPDCSEDQGNTGQ
jgi:hypothetical protein